MSDNDQKPFIPSWLDDSTLTSHQFRVFCHLSRRGNCWESLGSMAQCCKMRRPTVQKALSELLKRNAITKESRKGQTSIYTLAPDPKQALGGRPKRGTTPRPKTGTRDLTQKGHYKGTPSEGTPNKDTSRFFDSSSSGKGKESKW